MKQWVRKTFILFQFTILVSMSFAKNKIGFAVVELFTSEGCSSCPPADRLLSNIAEDAARHDKPIYALSFHVDYWNYLGWKDPFSRKEFSLRQNQYAEVMSGKIYTPQMIVNGQIEFTGSDAYSAQQAITNALANKEEASIDMKTSLSSNKKQVVLNYRLNGIHEGDILNIALVEKGLVSSVKRGENEGRSLHHDNVVRSFISLHIQQLESGALTINIPDMKLENTSIIAYMQHKDNLQVYAATQAFLNR